MYNEHVWKQSATQLFAKLLLILGMLFHVTVANVYILMIFY